MKQPNNKDYTLIQSGYQLKLPLNPETVIASDDPVRLLSQFVEELNLTDLYATMNRLYSSRDIETACTRDINFMYLLEGLPAPTPAPEPAPSKDDDNDITPLFTGTWNNPVSNGRWTQDSLGIWHYSNGQPFRAAWGYIVNPYAHDSQNTADWFRFDAHRNMLTGWQFINGRWYYLNPAKDGTYGACLLGTAVTPDGYEVDANGAWTGR